MSKNKYASNSLKTFVRILSIAFFSFYIVAFPKEGKNKSVILDSYCKEELSDMLRTAALIQDGLERAVALCEPVAEALLRSLQNMLDIQLRSVCKEIQEIESHIDEDSIAILKKIKEVECIVTQENNELLSHVFEVQALIDKAYEQKSVSLQEIGDIDQKNVEKLSVQIDTMFKTVSTAQSQGYSKEVVALNKGYSAAVKKIKELERAVRKGYQAIPALYRMAQTNIYGVLQENLVSIATNINRMLQNVVTQLDTMQVNNISLLKTQISALAETSNTFFYETLSDISAIKKNIAQTYDALNERVAAMCTVITKQEQGLQALVNDTNARLSATLCENNGQAQETLTKTFAIICACISDVQANMIVQIKECTASLVATINKTMLEACSKIITLDSNVTRQLENSAAQTIKECVESLQYLCLRVAQITQSSYSHGSYLIKELDLVSVDINQRVCEKASKIQASQVIAKNTIVSLLVTASIIIAEKICRSITRATTNVLIQGKQLCIKLQNISSNLKSLIHKKNEAIATQILEINTSLCSKIMTIQVSLSSQMVQGVAGLVTDVGIQNQGLSLQINQYYTGLQDLIGQRIEEHDAKSKLQYMHACSGLMDIIVEENMKAAVVGSQIEYIQDLFESDVQEFMGEIIPLMDKWTSLDPEAGDVTSILLELAELAVTIAKLVFEDAI